MTQTQMNSRAFLRWLSQQAHQPDPLEFLATGDGAAMMPRELEHMVAYLNALRLVRAHGWQEQARLPRQVTLSTDGSSCVRAFDGDVTAWSVTAGQTKS